MLKYFYLVFICLSIFTITSAQDHAIPKKRLISNTLEKEEADRARLYEKVIPTVVTIFTASPVFTPQGPQAQQGLGSGVLIGTECHILTAAHVVDGASKIMVKTKDDKVREATLLFSEASADIALLQLKQPDYTLSHATLGDSDNLAIGQNIYAIGSPYGLEHSFSSGIISAFRDFDKVYDGTIQVEFIQTDAAINSGNSGGPLFNSKGEVVGIASTILTVSGGFQGIGMAVTINTAKKLLASDQRPWVGVESIFLNQDQLKRLFNLDRDGGLLVQSIATGSPADMAGIKGGYIPAEINGQPFLLGGDIILQFGQQEACHAACLFDHDHDVKEYDKIEVTLLREGKEYKTEVDVSETKRSFLKIK